MSNSMDPQDLLYTNSFVNTDILSEKNIVNESKNYKRYQDYVNKNLNLTRDYLNNNGEDGDPINITKTLNSPWPAAEHKNRYPIFNKGILDVVENKYKKRCKTELSISSNDRDISKYLYPNNYKVSLNKVFYNIEKIRLKQIRIPNFYKSINFHKNLLQWQYPNINSLIKSNSDYNLIPTLYFPKENTEGIAYSSFPSAVSTKSLITLSKNFTPSNMSVHEMKKSFS